MNVDNILSNGIYFQQSAVYLQFLFVFSIPKLILRHCYVKKMLKEKFAKNTYSYPFDLTFNQCMKTEYHENCEKKKSKNNHIGV